MPFLNLSAYNKRIFDTFKIHLGLRRADHSSRGFLHTVVRHHVWSRNLVNEETLAHWGLSCQTQTNKPLRLNECFCVVLRWFHNRKLHKVPNCLLMSICPHVTSNFQYSSFISMAVYVAFVLDRMAVGQVFLQHVGYSCHNDSTNAPSSRIHPSPPPYNHSSWQKQSARTQWILLTFRHRASSI